jgi:hypothetical protein
MMLFFIHYLFFKFRFTLLPYIFINENCFHYNPGVLFKNRDIITISPWKEFFFPLRNTFFDFFFVFWMRRGNKVYTDSFYC